MKEAVINDDRQTLWVVSELYYPEETSTGYYVTKIAEGLADEMNVKVLCGQPTYSKRGTRAPKHEIHKGVEIFRVAGTAFDRNMIPLRLINMLTLGFSVFAASLRRFRAGEHVLVVTNPPSMPFVIAIASLVKGAAYTLLIHDTYPELMIAAGKAKAGSLFVRIANFANRWLYKHASKIIVVGRDMAEVAERKTQGLDVPVVTIQNWAELESVSPSARKDNQLLTELGLLDKFVFLYAGNMGYPNDVETIVQCAGSEELPENVHFVFLGAGAKRPWLERFIANSGLKNVTLLDPRPRSEQQVFLNACDVAIVSLVSGMKGVSVPSRTYNALAAGKPILALVEDGSEVERVLTEESVGWTVNPQDVGSFCQTVRTIVEPEAGSKLDAMSERARRAAVERYGLSTAIEKYRRTLSR